MMHKDPNQTWHTVAWPSFQWLQLFFVWLYLHTLPLTEWWWMSTTLSVWPSAHAWEAVSCISTSGDTGVSICPERKHFLFPAIGSCLIFSHHAQHPLHCRHLRKVCCAKLNCSLFPATRETSAYFVLSLCAVNSCSLHLAGLRFTTSPAYVLPHFIHVSSETMSSE